MDITDICYYTEINRKKVYVIMRDSLRKKILTLLTFGFVLFMAFGFSIKAEAVGKTYYLVKGYSLRLDNSGDYVKNYYNIHFYYKKSQVYCLRLDKLKPCDSYKKNPLPNWVMKKAKGKVGSKWGYNISKSTVNRGKALAIAGCALLVIVATICPVDGVAGDTVAWGLLLGVI